MKIMGKQWLQPEILVPVLTGLGGLCGILTIAASQFDAPDAVMLPGRQLGFLLIGLMMMMVTARIPFSKHMAWRGYYLLAAMAALLGLSWHGVRINGMLGWYRIGEYFIQPSEFGKVVFLLCLAGVAVSPSAARRRFPVMGLVALLWIVPVLLQPDFGTAAVYLLTWVVIYFAVGGSGKGVTMGIGMAILLLLVFIRIQPYAAERISVFLDPGIDPMGGGWHLRQLNLAIAQGGWTGCRLGQSAWSMSYLPLAYNDSSYAVMAETLGWLGAVPAVLLPVSLACRFFWSARDRQLPDAAAVYLGGAGILMAIQTLLHVCGNTGLIPLTGLNLPLISYGGSSLVGCCLMGGVAIAAARDREGGSGYRPMFE